MIGPPLCFLLLRKGIWGVWRFVFDDSSINLFEQLASLYMFFFLFLIVFDFSLASNFSVGLKIIYKAHLYFL